MLDLIRAALNEALQPFADTRIFRCQVEAVAAEGGRCNLAGVVLDAETLASLLAALTVRFPDTVFDTLAVRVLRSPNPVERIVATNLTGLYAQGSFLSEQLSQLLSGARLEQLMSEGRWAFVRQRDGYLGWVYMPYLAHPAACAVTHLISEPVSLLRVGPAPAAGPAGRLLAGTPVAVDADEAGWAHVATEGGMAGWVPSADLRSLTALPQGEAALRAQIVADAVRFTGVPYWWGGGSALGIDCSGFAQLMHRLSGVTLPRDADMQFDAGRPVAPPFQPGDLLFFGEAGARRKITHVAVSLGAWRIIHSSRSRNGVYQDDVQAVDHLQQSFVGARTFVAP